LLIETARPSVRPTDLLARQQVYAFLRRLGYVLTRARPIAGTERPVFVKPVPLYRTLLDFLSLPFLSTRDLVLRLAHAVKALVRQSPKTAKRIRMHVTRAVGKREGQMSCLAAGGRWTSYGASLSPSLYAQPRPKLRVDGLLRVYTDQIFSRLQIIPSGHDRALPRGPLAHEPSVFNPLVPVPEASRPEGLPSLEEYPFQPFFHVYKPVTKYKKSSPPPPDFKLVVIKCVLFLVLLPRPLATSSSTNSLLPSCSGTTTPMPDLFEFTAMFELSPFPEQPTPSSSAPRTAVSTAAKSRAPPSTRGPPRNSPSVAAPAPPPTRIQSLLSSIPFLPRLFPSLALPSAPDTAARRPPRKPSPYPQLKTGRRTILLAVVDNGTSSLLRFSEAEFAKLPWAGTPRSA